jgi:hypothetical protein
MMGLGSTCKLTPNFSGRVRLSFNGAFGDTTANSSPIAQIRYGTGTAPANAAALTGTTLGTSTISLITAASTFAAFTLDAIVSGLTPGTAYWFDLALTANLGTASIASVTFTAFEF